MTKIRHHRVSLLADREALPLYHGGDLAAARRLFPQAPEPWIDLSTGINPEPYPLPAPPLEAFTRLPDQARLDSLESIAAHRYSAPVSVEVVAAPGTQALIQLLPQLHKANIVGILGFTYGEYERVWRAAGLSPRIVTDLDALAACDLAIVVNPNNPDGKLVSAQELTALAKHLAVKGGLLVVDEAFIDVSPTSQSLVPILPEGALVLRSFGKTYGLPGLRLGFAVARASVAPRLRALLGPWAVSGLAIEVGRAALADDLWLASLPERLARQAATVEEALIACGARKIGGTFLFHLFFHERAEELFIAFGRRGILLRTFPEQPYWLRVGLVAAAAMPRLQVESQHIARAIAAGTGELSATRPLR